MGFVFFGSRKEIKKGRGSGSLYEAEIWAALEKMEEMMKSRFFVRSLNMDSLEINMNWTSGEVTGGNREGKKKDFLMTLQRRLDQGKRDSKNSGG